MTKKKMCQWIDRCFYKHNRTMLVDKSVCPKRVNNKCEIIPAKAKVRKLKSMANIDWDSGCYIVNAKNVRPKYFGGAFNVPCTITIAAKYLKEKRK